MNDTQLNQIIQKQDETIKRLIVSIKVLERQVAQLLRKQIILDEKDRYTNNQLQIISQRIKYIE